MQLSIALFAVICVVGVYSLTPEEFTKVKAEVEHCVDSNSFGQDVLDAKAGVFKVGTKAFNCLSGCIFKHNDNMLANIDSNTPEQAQRCKDLTGGHDCYKHCLEIHNIIHHPQ